MLRALQAPAIIIFLKYSFLNVITSWGKDIEHNGQMVHGEVDLGGELETNSGLPGGSCSSLDVSSTISLLAEGSELAILSPSFPFMNASRLAGKRMSFTLMIRESNMEKTGN